MTPKQEVKKRYRIPLEISEDDKLLWRQARGAAVQQGRTMGKYVIEAIHEKLIRDGALPMPPPKKK
jgi:uncharacterized protein (DUF1778 family)